MNLRLSQTLTIAVTLVAGVVSTGCRSHDYTGIWRGKTSQGETISFTITNKNWITRATLDCELECQLDGFCPTLRSFKGLGDVTATVHGNTFSAALSTATFSGKFDSETTASGDMTVTRSSPECGECKATVTWRAEKQFLD